jgi:hypothetical protein
MTSVQLYKKCKKCGKSFLKIKKKCDSCGAKDKSLFLRYFILIIVALFSISIISSLIEDNQQIESKVLFNDSILNLVKDYNIPESQISFVKLINSFSKEYKKSDNELFKTELRKKRKIKINETLSSLNINNWVGVISTLDTNLGGKAILSIKIGKNIKIETWNNILSDISYNTLIDSESDIYKILLKAKRNSIVMFSGEFFVSEKDYVYSSNLFQENSMNSPEFKFNFSNIKILKQ